MDKKSKILIIFVIVVVITSIGITFYKYFIKKDYTITTHVNCDPEVESCFYISCENLDCPEEIEYYKLIHKKAYNIDLCDSSDENCKPLTCKENEEGCEIILCSEENISNGEKCSTPNLSTINNN